jgi:hypothetical protein
MEKRKGYWTGKKKDNKTIQALSKSKFKKCYTYDLSGKLLKVYESYKECANELIGDYEIKNVINLFLVKNI